MIGQTVAHYRIKEKLGEGGMGVVYLAEDTRLGREVALKALAPEFARNPQRRKRFQQEARAAAALSHAGIAAVYALEEVGDELYIVYEYVRGRTLRELVAPGGMKLEELLDVATDIARALSAAHELPVVHRDLKPENIMRTADGEVKILDFGLARFQSPGLDAETATARLTVAGSVLGTVAYMSPEQLEGKELDFRSDIFSFGTMLYELATGKRPFEGASPASTIANILTAEPAALREHNPLAPAELDRIVRKCLRKRREERYQSTRDLAVDLETLRRETIGEAPRAAAAAVEEEGLEEPSLLRRAFAVFGATPRRWWELQHLGAVFAFFPAYFYFLGWKAREKLPPDSGTLLFLALLLSAAGSMALRSYLVVSGAFNPRGLGAEVKRLGRYVHGATRVFMMILAAMGVSLIWNSQAQAGLAWNWQVDQGALVLGFALIGFVLSLVMEPTIERAAFPKTFSSAEAAAEAKPGVLARLRRLTPLNWWVLNQLAAVFLFQPLIAYFLFRAGEQYARVGFGEFQAGIAVMNGVIVSVAFRLYLLNVWLFNRAALAAEVRRFASWLQGVLLIQLVAFFAVAFFAMGRGRDLPELGLLLAVLTFIGIAGVIAVRLVEPAIDRAAFPQIAEAAEAKPGVLTRLRGMTPLSWWALNQLAAVFLVQPWFLVQPFVIRFTAVLPRGERDFWVEVGFRVVFTCAVVSIVLRAYLLKTWLFNRDALAAEVRRFAPGLKALLLIQSVGLLFGHEYPELTLLLLLEASAVFLVATMVEPALDRFAFPGVEAKPGIIARLRGMKPLSWWALNQLAAVLLLQPMVIGLTVPSPGEKDIWRIAGFIVVNLCAVVSIVLRVYLLKAWLVNRDGLAAEMRRWTPGLKAALLLQFAGLLFVALRTGLARTRPDLALLLLGVAITVLVVATLVEPALDRAAGFAVPGLWETLRQRLAGRVAAPAREAKPAAWPESRQTLAGIFVLQLVFWAYVNYVLVSHRVRFEELTLLSFASFAFFLGYAICLRTAVELWWRPERGEPRRFVEWFPLYVAGDVLGVSLATVVLYLGMGAPLPAAKGVPPPVAVVIVAVLFYARFQQLTLARKLLVESGEPVAVGAPGAPAVAPEFRWIALLQIPYILLFPFVLHWLGRQFLGRPGPDTFLDLLPQGATSSLYLAGVTVSGWMAWRIGQGDHRTLAAFVRWFWALLLFDLIGILVIGDFITTMEPPGTVLALVLGVVLPLACLPFYQRHLAQKLLAEFGEPVELPAAGGPAVAREFRWIALIQIIYLLPAGFAVYVFGRLNYELFGLPPGELGIILAATAVYLGGVVVTGWMAWRLWQGDAEILARFVRWFWVFFLIDLLGTLVIVGKLLNDVNVAAGMAALPVLAYLPFYQRHLAQKLLGGEGPPA